MNSQTIIFFDGVCHLCNGFVDWLVRADKKRRLKFAPLQGTTAAEILSAQDRLSLESVILYDSGKNYYRSRAILKAIAKLGGIYSLVSVFKIIPQPWADYLYQQIAVRRYKLFGQREVCRLPLESEKSYLLP